MSDMRNQRAKPRLKPSDLNVKKMLNRLWSIELKFSKSPCSGPKTAVSLPLRFFVENQSVTG
jgi:hypothetical protein